MIDRFTLQRIELQTIVYREISRFLRIWTQTLIPPVIMTVLYFVIFGNLIGRYIPDMDGHKYIDFIVPGLIMLAVINNSYLNVVSSFFSAKFQRYIEELLVSPTSNLIILVGYLSGGVLRGLLVGGVVLLVACFFTDVQFFHPYFTLLVALLTAILFAVAGFINAMLAKKFDDISIIPTFVLQPLVYLGGVFYSIDLLPSFWQTVSLFNPILYMVNAFRYGFLGVSDIELPYAILVILLMTSILFIIAWRMLKSGYGLRS